VLTRFVYDRLLAKAYFDLLFCLATRRWMNLGPS
jgi:hypothetical protein